MLRKEIKMSNNNLKTTGVKATGSEQSAENNTDSSFKKQTLSKTKSDTLNSVKKGEKNENQ